jgi:hypothetical protein
LWHKTKNRFLIEHEIYPKVAVFQAAIFGDICNRFCAAAEIRNPKVEITNGVDSVFSCHLGPVMPKQGALEA